MTLNREKLRQTLDELHAQLDEADSLDADLAAQLRSAAAEISLTLRKQTPAGSAAEDQPELDGADRVSESVSTPEILEDAAVQFEQSHPTIAGTVRRLIDMLAQMGI